MDSYDSQTQNGLSGPWGFRSCLGFLCIVGRKVWWIYEICGVRIYESGQDIWQGHLHTRPADLRHPKDHAHDVRIVTI